MGVLSELEPKSVFRFFEEICSIPHGSGNTKQISDYCAEFAQKRGLRFVQDGADNVIIRKNGTSGYEGSAPVILQGHIDMVCEKTADSGIDMEKDGLRLRLDGDVISADGTTLGGDDGIAVAYALAILDSDDIPHPPLEVVLTSDEEIGMLGAVKLDFSLLRSRTMINIDSEKEGCLLTSCAGGVRAACTLPIKREKYSGLRAEIRVSGLLGGHSGAEINKVRANSNMLMGRVLNEMPEKLPFKLISVSGGTQDNAIPRETTAELLIPPQEKSALEKFISEQDKIISDEYRETDPKASVSVSFGEISEENVMTEVSRGSAVAALHLLPGGVQKMSEDIPGLVQTSLNMGILETDENEVKMCFCVRSSAGAEKEALIAEIEEILRPLGGSVSLEGDYPAWEYRKDSPLRDVMTKTYERLYGKKPEVQAIHAGLECGLFAGALPGLDCVSFGPDMEDIHTVNERLSVRSVKRTWEYLLEVLKELK